MEIIASRIGEDRTKDEWKKLSKQEKNRKIELHPEAAYLRDDFMVSVIGIVLTVTGLLVEFLSGIFP